MSAQPDVLDDFRQALEPNSRAALLVLESAGSCCSMSSTLDLGDGLWFLPACPLKPDKSFVTWHGSLADKLIRSSGFVIAAAGDSNADDLQLRRQVMLLFDGIVILSLPRLGKGWLLSVDGSLNIGSWSQPPERYVVARYKSTGKVTETTLRDAKTLAQALRGMTQGSRLERGAYALESALTEKRLQERLHKFVRALEALVKPEKGATRRQFVHRCQTFAMPNDSAAATLGEIYDIRCAVEHMHDGLTVAPKAELKKRLAQVEFLATRAYAHLLMKPAIRQRFESDAAIDAFWQLDDGERQRTWGLRVNLDTDATPRLHYEWT